MTTEKKEDETALKETKRRKIRRVKMRGEMTITKRKNKLYNNYIKKRKKILKITNKIIKLSIRYNMQYIMHNIYVKKYI